VQPLNALLPIDITESGMIASLRDVQPSNVCLAMEVIELGKLTEARPVLAKAATPMLLTE